MENNIADKFIDFIITQKCTYRCVYCSQSKAQTKQHNEASPETIDSFYRLLDRLEKNYEITITGGEALLHPHFFEIIKTTKEKGFKINLITNLSSKIEQYQKIFELLGDKLNRFDVSFHFDEIQNFNLMIEKLELFLITKPHSTKTTFFIPLFDVNDKKESKIDKIIRIAKKHKINYEFQKIRFLDKYKQAHNEKYESHHKKLKTFGNLCLAGCNSAVIYENGEVYRCYSSRFNDSNYLGNINELNFKLDKSEYPCSNCVCSCPKPAKYNQILNEKDYKTALIDSFKNLSHLPSLIIKNKEIIIAKLKQLITM